MRVPFPVAGPSTVGAFGGCCQEAVSGTALGVSANALPRTTAAAASQLPMSSGAAKVSRVACLPEPHRRVHRNAAVRHDTGRVAPGVLYHTRASRVPQLLQLLAKAATTTHVTISMAPSVLGKRGRSTLNEEGEILRIQRIRQSDHSDADGTFVGRTGKRRTSNARVSIYDDGQGPSPSSSEENTAQAGAGNLHPTECRTIATRHIRATRRTVKAEARRSHSVLAAFDSEQPDAGAPSQSVQGLSCRRK